MSCFEQDEGEKFFLSRSCLRVCVRPCQCQSEMKMN